MENIIKYMYKNISEKGKILANYIDEENEYNIKNLKSEDVARFSNYLNEKVGGGTFERKIGIFVHNSLAFVNAFYSIELNGNIVVGINTKVSLEELNHIIEVNNMDTIITNDEFYDFVSGSNIKNIINYDKVNLEDYPQEFNKKVVLPDFKGVMLISYTSGTSGKFSKPVETTFENVSFVSEEYKKIYKLDKNSNCITVLPLWHNYAMFACLTSSIVAGSCISIMKHWDLKTFLILNEKLKPQVFPGSPYMYIDIINNEKMLHKLKNLKVCDSGGDSLPIECIKRFEKITGAVITEGYGLTETTSLTHFNYSAAERKVGSLGKCVSNTQCKILDLQGNELPDNTWGILWIKGPMVFKGYVGIDKKDTENLTEDGWFNTNDVVKRDKDGFYFFAGRFTDLNSLDESSNQFRDLENKLYQFEGIKRVHIKTNINKVGNFSYFDIIAELKENYTIQNLYDYINTNLKGYVIDNVKIVSDLPTTGTGKVKRNKINEILEVIQK